MMTLGEYRGNSPSCDTALWLLQTDDLWALYNLLTVLMSGRYRVTTTAQARYIRVRHLWNRATTETTTATQIPGLHWISDQTVYNRLGKTGISPRRPVPRNVLTSRHLAERLQWYQQRVKWTRAKWRSALFSDEFCVLPTRAVGRTRVYRHWMERYAPNCVQQVARFDGGSVVVWTGIHLCDRCTAAPQRADIILGCRTIWCTGAACTLQESRATPPPDTSVISYGTAAWVVEQFTSCAMFASMRRRCQAVIRARGDHNRHWHFAHPMSHICLCTCFLEIMDNLLPITSWSLVACITSTSFVIKLWKSMSFLFLFGRV